MALGSLAPNFSAGSIATAGGLTVELINRLINVQLNEMSRKIEGLEGRLATDANTVEDYKIQTIDPTIKCDTALEVVKSLPKFTGEPTQYVGWREAAETVTNLYKVQSEQYFNASTILRNKITNHGTVLNFRAILSRLDFIYSDKRPIHILKSELTVLRQGRMTVTESYNEVNKKMTLLIHKTTRSNALRTFISGLNGSISETLFSFNPPDLPNALVKVQKLESNNFRAQFANRFNGFKNENKCQGNNLRFDQNDRIIILIKWEIIGVITRIIIGHKRKIFGKIIIKITIKTNKKSSQWMLVHRFNSRIYLITIGSQIIIGRQIIIEVDIIIISIKIIIVQITIAQIKI